MRSGLFPLLLVAAVLASPAHAVRAQERPGGLREVLRNERDGFWLNVGFGAGLESYRLDQTGSRYTENLTRPTFFLRLGGTPGQAVLLGGELVTWINDEGDATETLSHVGLVAQWYPASRGALYLKGGVGLGDNRFVFDDGFERASAGFSVAAGLGYDLRVGRNVSLTPAVDVVWQRYDRFAERIVNLGLGVTFH